MAAMVFGIGETISHRRGSGPGDGQHEPRVYMKKSRFLVELKPRVRTYREKTRRSSIIESTEKKLETRRQLLEQQKEEECRKYSHA